MYIMTKDNRIVNLDHYCRVEICSKNSSYKLRATLPIISEDQCIYDDIASFDKEEDATYILHVFFNAFANKDHICDLNTIEFLSELWCEVKQSIAEEILSQTSLNKLELRITGFRKIVVIYPYKCLQSVPVGVQEANELADDLKKKLESRSPIDGEWEVKAEPA